MASGDTLVFMNANHLVGYGANPATFDTTGDEHGGYRFDASTDESVVAELVLPRHYGGSGITVYLHWRADTATTNNVYFQTAFERIGDQQHDTDLTTGFATANSGNAAAPSTLGFVDIISIAHTDGAQIDSIAVGEAFRLKINRDADNASDNMAGDAILVRVELKET